MAKDPAFLFYSSDFLSGTYTMSNEQVGKYIRLLCLQHQKFALTEHDMLNICGTYDVDIFSKFENVDGKYFNTRLRDESEKRKKYSESRRKNKMSKHMTNTSSSYVEHMENENENVIENKNQINISSSKNFPNSNEIGSIPDIKIQMAIELIYRTQRIKIINEDVIRMWDVFKMQHLDGKTWYPSETKIHSHFINWIKNQKFQHVKQSNSNDKWEQTREYANRHDS